jgi:hypothetical protein
MKTICIIGLGSHGSLALQQAITYCHEHEIEIYVPDGENMSHGLPISEPEPILLTIPDTHFEPIVEKYIDLIDEPKRKKKRKKVNNTFGNSNYF